MVKTHKILFLSMSLIVTSNKIWTMELVQEKLSILAIKSLQDEEDAMDSGHDIDFVGKTKEEIKAILRRQVVGMNKRDGMKIHTELLKVAAKKGNLLLVQALIEIGVPLSSSFIKDEKLENKEVRNYLQANIDLYRAAGYGDTEKVRAAWEAGAYIDSRSDELDRTSLHLAAYWGRKAVVQFLIEARADVNAQTCLKDTPIHYAIYGNMKNGASIVKKLLAAGASKNITGNLSCTPLMLAKELGFVQFFALLEAE